MKNLEFNALSARIRVLEKRDRMYNEALDDAMSALFALRTIYENQGEYFDGFATQSLRRIQEKRDKAKSVTP